MVVNDSWVARKLMFRSKGKEMNAVRLYLAQEILCGDETRRAQLVSSFDYCVGLDCDEGEDEQYFEVLHRELPDVCAAGRTYREVKHTGFIFLRLWLKEIWQRVYIMKSSRKLAFLLYIMFSLLFWSCGVLNVVVLLLMLRCVLYLMEVVLPPVLLSTGFEGGILVHDRTKWYNEAGEVVASGRYLLGFGKKLYEVCPVERDVSYVVKALHQVGYLNIFVPFSKLDNDGLWDYGGVWDLLRDDWLEWRRDVDNCEPKSFGFLDYGTRSIGRLHLSY